MVDLTDAVQTACYDNLRNGVTLAAVYSVIPEGAQPPIVTIADASVTVIVPDFEAHDVRIVTIVAGGSKRALFAAMRQVKEALDLQPLTFLGANLGAPTLGNSSDRLSDDGLALIGEQTFQIYAQPED